MVTAFYSSKIKPKDFELGQSVDQFTEHPEIGIRDLGRLLSRTCKSKDASLLCYESYKRGAWQGGTNLFENGNLSGERGRNHLSELVLNYRNSDSIDYEETGQQKWLFIAGKTGLILCISGETFLFDETAGRSWSKSPVAFEEWTEEDLLSFTSGVQSLSLGLAPFEDELLASLTYEYGINEIVEDPDFDREIEENSPLGEACEGWFAWETRFGYPIYLHLGDYTHYFQGPISPNYGSTFRRLITWICLAKDRFVFGGEIEGFPLNLDSDESEPDVIIVENYWLASGEPLSGGLMVRVKSAEVKNSLIESLEDFKLLPQITWDK